MAFSQSLHSYAYEAKVIREQKMNQWTKALWWLPVQEFWHCFADLTTLDGYESAAEVLCC